MCLWHTKPELAVSRVSPLGLGFNRSKADTRPRRLLPAKKRTVGTLAQTAENLSLAPRGCRLGEIKSEMSWLLNQDCSTPFDYECHIDDSHPSRINTPPVEHSNVEVRTAPLNCFFAAICCRLIIDCSETIDALRIREDHENIRVSKGDQTAQLPLWVR